MTKSEIKVGGWYATPAGVGEVKRIYVHDNGPRKQTAYIVKGVDFKGTNYFRSAAKFRFEIYPVS